MINNIHDIVLNNPKVKMREITEIVSISTELLSVPKPQGMAVW